MLSTTDTWSSLSSGIRWFERVERSEVRRVIKKAVWTGQREKTRIHEGEECEASLVHCSRWGPTENNTSVLYGSCGRVWG